MSSWLLWMAGTCTALASLILAYTAGFQRGEQQTLRRIGRQPAAAAYERADAPWQPVPPGVDGHRVGGRHRRA